MILYQWKEVSYGKRLSHITWLYALPSRILEVMPMGKISMGVRIMIDSIVKIASTIVNTIMVSFKISDLVKKLKKRHQKSNRPTKD